MSKKKLDKELARVIQLLHDENNIQGGSNFITKIIRNVTDKVKSVINKNVIPAIKGRELGQGPPQIRKILSQYGNEKIISATVCREPVNKLIEKFFSLVSDNEYDEAKARSNYDDMFHLFLNLTLESGKSFRFDKDEVIKSKPGKKVSSKGVCLDVNINNEVTLQGMFDAAENSQGSSNFWVYDAYANNCQVFVHTMLKASGLITPELSNFILQDVEDIAQSSGVVGRLVAKFAPKLAERWDILMHGAGKKIYCKHCDKTFKKDKYDKHIKTVSHSKKIYGGFFNHPIQTNKPIEVLKREDDIRHNVSLDPFHN